MTLALVLAALRHLTPSPLVPEMVPQPVTVDPSPGAGAGVPETPPLTYCVDTNPFCLAQITGSHPPLAPPRTDTEAPSARIVMMPAFNDAADRQRSPPLPVPVTWTVPSLGDGAGAVDPPSSVMKLALT